MRLNEKYCSNCTTHKNMTSFAILLSSRDVFVQILESRNVGIIMRVKNW